MALALNYCILDSMETTKLGWEHPVLDVFLKQKSTHNVKEEKKLWLLIKCVSETIERGCGVFAQVRSKKLKKYLNGYSNPNQNSPLQRN